MSYDGLVWFIVAYCGLLLFIVFFVLRCGLVMNNCGMMGSVHESRQKRGFHDASHDGFHNGFHANSMKAWSDGLWWQDDGLWWLVTYYDPPRMLCMVVLFGRADDGEPAYRVGLCSKQHGTKELSIGRIIEVKGVSHSEYLVWLVVLNMFTFSIIHHHSILLTFHWHWYFSRRMIPTD